MVSCLTFLKLLCVDKNKSARFQKLWFLDAFSLLQRSCPSESVYRYIASFIWLVMSVGEICLDLDSSAQTAGKPSWTRLWPAGLDQTLLCLGSTLASVLSSLFSVSRSEPPARLRRWRWFVGGGPVQNRHFRSGLSQEVPHPDGSMSSQRASRSSAAL